jgi:hypothetical protein
MFPSGFSAANSNVEIYIVGAGEYEQGKQGTDEQRQENSGTGTCERIDFRKVTNSCGETLCV